MIQLKLYWVVFVCTAITRKEDQETSFVCNVTEVSRHGSTAVVYTFEYVDHCSCHVMPFND